MVFESYRLVLHHEYITDDGTKVSIEPPLVLQQCFERSELLPGSTYLLNDILERFKIEVLKRASEGGNQ